MKVAEIRKEYKSIIDMLNSSVKNHPKPTDNYEKGFLAGMREAIVEIKIASKIKI